MVWCNVERFVMVCLSQENRICDEINPIGKVMKQLDPCEKVLLYSVYKCYRLLQFVKKNREEDFDKEFESTVIKDSTEKAKVDFKDALVCMGLPEGEASADAESIDKISTWDKNMIDVLVTLAVTVSYRDIQIGLQIMSEFIYEWYIRLEADRFTTLEKMGSQYVISVCS